MTVQVQQPPMNASLNFVRPVFQKFFDFEQFDSQTVSVKGSHFAGFFKGIRLFGGNTAAHGLLAAKRFRSGQPYRIDVNFFAPGTLHHDLIINRCTSNDNESDFISLDIYQNSILIANANIRFHEDPSFIEQAQFHRHAQFPSNILKPNAYSKVMDLIDKLPMDEWRTKYGRSFKYHGASDETQIFVIRPIDYLHFAGLSDRDKPIQVWAQLSPVLLDCPIKDPEAILILLSDSIIGNPIYTLHDQRYIRITSSSTLHHKCIIHELDFDPRGHFFMELDLHQANTTALIQGRIFDEKKLLLMTFAQNHYYNLHKDDFPSSKL